MLDGVNLAVGSVLVLIGLALLFSAPWFAGLMRRRDDRRADPRRDLDWSQNLDVGIFRFLGVCVVLVGALILVGIIPLST